MTKILLIEDEPGLVLTATDLLTSEGYEVEAAMDGEAGARTALAGGFDLILLDWMLPRKSGVDVCRELREAGLDVPVLMLTARSQVADRVTGLKLGADDYVGKPFDPAELLARIEALLRRSRRPKVAAMLPQSFAFGEIQADFSRAEVFRNGKRVTLASREMDLLRYLVEHRARMITREEILTNVWKYNPDVSSRTIDVHVAWLRQKLEVTPQTPVHIITVRGKGYRFQP
jgi:two-component system alkaline phosphatase synthesis response regulator PhoP